MVSVIVFKVPALISYPKVTERLKQITCECAGLDVSPEPGEVLNVMYPHLTKDIYIACTSPSLMYELNADPSRIMGFTITVSSNTHIEIWDCCVAAEFRRQGVFTTLLSEVMRSNPWTDNIAEHKAMWVGIRPNHPLMKHILRVYSRFNFGAPVATSKTGLGADFGCKMLGLWWMGKLHTDVDKLIESVESLNFE